MTTSVTPVINALVTRGWRLGQASLTTGGLLLLARSPDGVWGASQTSETGAAALDAGFLRAALNAAEREGATPDWLQALAALPPVVTPTLADLEERLVRLEAACQARWPGDADRVTHIVRQLAAEFEV